MTQRKRRKRTEKQNRRAARPRSGPTRVANVMVRGVVTIDSGATLREAAERMRNANVGMLPVVETDAVCGVITDRDLVVRAMTQDVRPSEGRVRDYVSAPPRCAEEDWTVEEAMEEMAAQHVGRLPVDDAGGRAIGVVTLSSLALRSRKQDRALETAQEVSRRSSRAA
jgi:CBS domain-containing protein